MLKFDYSNTLSFVRQEEIDRIAPQVELSCRLLSERRGPGSEFTGWLDLASRRDKTELDRILRAARRIRDTSDVLVVIGIGGSYLGARAAIEMLSPAFPAAVTNGGTAVTNGGTAVTNGGTAVPTGGKGVPQIVFCGQNLSASYMSDLMEWLKTREVSVNVISKSGTTTEPAIAFRVLRSFMEAKYGKAGARSRIYATTDQARGALRSLAVAEGYESFVVPDDIGGRYSVLTAVGLLPIAAAGIDISRMLDGAADCAAACDGADIRDNPASLYAAVRNVLLRRGFRIEILASYEPYLHSVGEWWKQLFGESEGKDGKGIFPATMDNTTDLHSIGQYVQDGSRILFETVVDIRQPRIDFEVPAAPESADGLEFLAGRGLHGVNRTAMRGTILAHVDGGVPNLRIELPGLTPHAFGQMVYFFEKACAISGYLLSVNPFDQPGVEAYKQNMFALLGKPGYEGLKAELEKRIHG